MIQTAKPINKVTIRRAIYEGNAGELLATREIEKGKFIIVVYREVSADDGFVITSFLTKRVKQLERRKKIWQPPA